MNGQRKPRRPRWVKSTNTLDIALFRATKLLPDEIAARMDPLRDAHRALREGRATELQWTVIASAVAISLSIEKKGIVRGLIEHLTKADLALARIEQRARKTKTWKPTSLYFDELDSVTTLLELFEYQLQNLSAKEYDQAWHHAKSETARTGGRLIKAPAKPTPSTPAQACA
ncbi:hypothetical protein [Limnohabitans sp. WS1]|uniref:hypothetical protein n=1 Tax=Limnohabitans sp. WS1 TaxID=1100726 RepID=UPI000D345B26|nr:hypothetical protein [Limnohabitans sp. WS1]PUE20329.1 hypothetical protein B9Z48_05265 [Limnohabitans sp. WS1]